MKIGVLDSGYASYSIEKDLLKEYGFGLEIFGGHFGDQERKIEFAKDKVGLFIRQTEIDKAFLDALPHLKAIVRYGVGYDNINLFEAKAHGVKVANVQGYATYCVADHAMALMFSCLRSLPKGEQDIYDRFGKPSVPDIFELHDKTLGIIGLGRIGSRFALCSSPLFKKVLAVDPYVDDARFFNTGAIRTDLSGLLSSSHVISIHCSLTDKSFHLINRESINSMKNRPVIINTARGPIINEKDLLRALEEDRIHSAGIDVWEDEPVTSKQESLISHPRVISTGHYAWYSENSAIELQRRAAENMLALLGGTTIPDQLA
jgi:D-3-phosphoglycerate dehydrogenase